MDDRTPLALPQFLRFLAALPNASRVAEALVRGPLAGFGSQSAIIWTTDGASVDRIGSYGTDTETDLRYSQLPLSLALPACEVIREHRATLLPLTTLGERYPLMRLDAELLERGLGRTPNGALLTAPIMAGGRDVGSWSSHVADPPASLADASWLVTALSAALSLWLAHPSAPIGDPMGMHAAGLGVEPIALTERQQQVLALVLEHLSNSEIAERLHASRSTVKHDVQRAMRSMRTNDRLTAARRARDLGLLATGVEVPA